MESILGLCCLLVDAETKRRLTLVGVSGGEYVCCWIFRVFSVCYLGRLMCSEYYSGL